VAGIRTCSSIHTTVIFIRPKGRSMFLEVISTLTDCCSRVDRGAREPVAGNSRYVERVQQPENVNDRRVADRYDRNDRGGRGVADRGTEAAPRRVDDRREVRDASRRDDRLPASRDDRGGRDQRFDRYDL